MIITWLTTLITFLLGYALGKYENPEVKVNIKNIIKKAKRSIKGQKIGAIKNLTAEEQYIRNNPILKGEEEEMERVLDGKLNPM